MAIAGPGAGLREARPDEAPALRRLLDEAFREYDGLLDPPAAVTLETAETLAAKIARGGALLWETPEGTAGCLFWRPEGEHLYVGPIGVRPAHRREGIGGLLLDAVARKALDRGVTRIRLETRIVLTGLRRWYERRGFEFVAFRGHPGYTKDIYVELEKKLTV